LRQQKLLAAGPVGALEEPAAQSRRAFVNGIASGVLLRLGPHRLGIAHNEIAQRRAAAGRVFEARRRNCGKFPRDLHHRPGKRQSRSQAALQPDRTLPASRGGLDHVAITRGDELRDHPGVGEIDLIDGVACAVADDALSQSELPQIGL
jgi:hypothetical protein